MKRYITIISKFLKPINNINSQDPTGNGTQPISNFKQHKSYSLGPKSNSIRNILINSQQVMGGSQQMRVYSLKVR